MVILDLFVNTMFVVICSSDYNYRHDLAFGFQSSTKRAVYVCELKDGYIFDTRAPCESFPSQPKEIFRCNSTM